MSRKIKPYKFVVRGPISALKNDRRPIQKPDGTVISVPNAAVKRNVKHIQAAFQRQLPEYTDDAILFDGSKEVAFLALIGVYARTEKTIPNKDTDNMLTTLQEAMQGVIIPPAQNKGDRIVSGPLPFRRKFLVRNLVHTVVWVWEDPGVISDNLLIAYKIAKRYGV